MRSERNPVAARVLSAGLALLLLALASVPCPGPGPAGAAVADPAPTGASLYARVEPSARPAAIPASDRELRPACPCGCAHAPATASASTRLPAALLPASPAPLATGAPLRPQTPPPSAVAWHAPAIDHVPIGSSRLHRSHS